MNQPIRTIVKSVFRSTTLGANLGFGIMAILTIISLHAPQIISVLPPFAAPWLLLASSVAGVILRLRTNTGLAISPPESGTIPAADPKDAVK